MSVVRLPALLLVTALLALAVHAADTAKVGAGRTALAQKNRIVIQVNDENSKYWNAVLGNIRNIQTELGARNVSIAVIAIGPGLGMITADSLTATGVQDAIISGVEFVACGNSMKAQQVAKDDLVDGVTIATAGYVELMKRQQQGWGYLRP